MLWSQELFCLCQRAYLGSQIASEACPQKDDSDYRKSQFVDESVPFVSEKAIQAFVLCLVVLCSLTFLNLACFFCILCSWASKNTLEAFADFPVDVVLIEQDRWREKHYHEKVID